MVRIVLAEFGHVWVGHVERGERTLRITDAACVRRCGTRFGLGEIALGGPNGDTMLDEIGSMDVELSRVIAVMDCNQERWNRRDGKWSK